MNTLNVSDDVVVYRCSTCSTCYPINGHASCSWPCEKCDHDAYRSVVNIEAAASYGIRPSLSRESMLSTAAEPRTDVELVLEALNAAAEGRAANFEKDAARRMKGLLATVSEHIRRDLA